MPKKNENIDSVKRILKVYGKRVVIKRLDNGEISEGGIHIPDCAREDGRLAQVRHVGTEVSDFEPGEYVLTTKYRGSDIEVDGEILCVVKADDCWLSVEV